MGDRIRSNGMFCTEFCAPGTVWWSEVRRVRPSVFRKPRHAAQGIAHARATADSYVVREEDQETQPI